MYRFWNQFCVQFQFLKKLKHTVLFSHLCLFQNALTDLLTPNLYVLTNSKKCCFQEDGQSKVLKFQNPFLILSFTHFLRFIICDIFSEIMLVCFHLKHVLLSLTFIIDIPRFHNVLNHPRGPTSFYFNKNIIEGSHEIVM